MGQQQRFWQTSGCIASVVAAVGTAIFSILVSCTVISDYIYLFLMAGLAVTCCALAAPNRISEVVLGAKGARVILREIQEAEQRVNATRDEVARIAEEVTKLALFIGVWQQSIDSTQAEKQARVWIANQVRKITMQVSGGGQPSREVTKYLDAMLAIAGLEDRRDDLQEAGHRSEDTEIQSIDAQIGTLHDEVGKMILADNLASKWFLRKDRASDPESTRAGA